MVVLKLGPNFFETLINMNEFTIALTHTELKKYLQCQEGHVDSVLFARALNHQERCSTTPVLSF